MTKVAEWWRSHATAVLGTALLVSKSGVLGSKASGIVSAVAVFLSQLSGNG